MSTNSFKTDSQNVTEFLKQPKGHTISRLHELKAALERPDGFPEAMRTAEPETPAPSPVVAVQSAVPPTARADDAQVSMQQSARQAPSSATTHELPPSANGAMEIPAAEPNRGGRPLLGAKPKVEKTFAIDENIHLRLIEISNWEGIRHKKKFSVSHMMNHALTFALAHMEGTHMIPIDGKDGLVIPVKPTEEQPQ